MRISLDGLNFIKKHEGLKPTSYQCSARVWTICYGHTANVRPGQSIDLQTANLLLLADIVPSEYCILKTVSVGINQNQFDALVSSIFNVGDGNFTPSTLLKKINTKDIEGAAEQFLRWNKVQGVEIRGLTRRREDERHLFLSQF